MTEILVFLGFIAIGLLGYWMMGRIDAFVSSSDWRPYYGNETDYTDVSPTVPDSGSLSEIHSDTTWNNGKSS